jgi:hypothetical protein
MEQFYFQTCSRPDTQNLISSGPGSFSEIFSAQSVYCSQLRISNRNMVPPSHLERSLLEQKGAQLVNQTRTQWQNPAHIASLLLLVGGYIVQYALAQQTGDTLPTPGVFSFGWVSYTFLGLLSTISNGGLLPIPERLPYLPSRCHPQWLRICCSCAMAESSIAKTSHQFERAANSWINHACSCLC